MVQVGETYRHNSGTTYRIDEMLFSAENYETTSELPEAVIYTQLQDGEVKPAGTRYVRTLNDFLKNFVKVEPKSK
jgi:hypothetical protein